MKRIATSLFLCASVVVTSAPFTLGGQQSSASSTSNALKMQAAAEKTKSKVHELGVAKRVTVVLKNGNEYYGGISQIGDESFQLAEIDLNQQLTIAYSDVKKIKSGFGKPNPFNGKRWSTTSHKIALIATLGAFIVLTTLARFHSR